MNVEVRQRAAGRRAQRGLQRTAFAALWLSLAAGALSVLRLLSPPEDDYTDHLVPAAAPLVAAAVGVVAAALVVLAPLRASRARAVQVTSAVAAALCVWAASGLPLDLLRMAGLIPLDIDWPGFAMRAAASWAALALAVSGLLYGRVASGACLRCGRTTDGEAPATGPVWYGYVAFVCALPYPALKAYWALGGTAGTADPNLIEGFSDGWGTVIPGVLGALLALALVQQWGRRLPRVPLLLAGAGGSALLVTAGLPGTYAAIGMIADDGFGAVDGDTKAWVFTMVYGGWLAMAIAMALATWSYWHRTRPRCPRCHRH